MKESLVQQCLDILQKEDIKKEFRSLLKPVIDFILYEINPYIYITISLVFLILLLRNKQILTKIFSENK
jgi:hypothetical protein